jgi:hypothetical protein
MVELWSGIRSPTRLACLEDECLKRSANPAHCKNQVVKEQMVGARRIEHGIRLPTGLLSENRAEASILNNNWVNIDNLWGFALKRLTRPCGIGLFITLVVAELCANNSERVKIV